jgi:hypothetical protein
MITEVRSTIVKCRVVPTLHVGRSIYVRYDDAQYLDVELFTWNHMMQLRELLELMHEE